MTAVLFVCIRGQSIKPAVLEWPDLFSCPTGGGTAMRAHASSSGRSIQYSSLYQSYTACVPQTPAPRLLSSGPGGCVHPTQPPPLNPQLGSFCSPPPEATTQI